jgi:c(7)-type cytochrome triheme protein
VKRAALIFVAFALIAIRFAMAEPDPDAGTDWSPVVYPLQRLPVIFSHQQHAKRGTPCSACHPAGSTSQSAVDDLLPTEAACKPCHAIDRAAPTQPACAKCHPGWSPGAAVQPTYLTPAPIHFAHAQHTKTPCVTCHGDMAGVDLATTKQLPTMASCMTCHPSGGDPGHCTDCHLAQRGGLLETRFEQGDLVPAQDGLGDAHGPEFATRHTVEARQPGATCNACHDQSECVACHQGVTKPTDFHPGDYTFTHAIDARRGKPECSACHRLESFCVGCHERSGVATRAHTDFNDVDPSRRFHPAGWAAPSGGVAANLHAQDARRNISSCTSCHREEDCQKCHTAEAGQGASPHPKSWRGSARCKALDRANRRMCLRCHIAQNELGCDW